MQISKRLRETPVDTNTTVNAILTVDGFSETEATLEDQKQSKKVFIACKFDIPYQDDLVKTIKAACMSCGFVANLMKD